MPVPSYFKPPRPKPQSLSVITGGMTAAEIRTHLDAGARFVVFQYNISALIISIRRNSPIQFIRAGESLILKGLPYTAISLTLGWWGFPWGLIYTPQVLYKNFAGGTDVTNTVLEKLDLARSAGKD